MYEIIRWIELHPVSVDVLMWVVILLLAWASGIFKLIKRYAKKPSASIIAEASRCYIEYIDEYEGYKNLNRAAFLIDVTVRNPTTEHIVVESFSFSYFQNKALFSRSAEYHSITIPNRPRQEMGSGIKASKVFFTFYNDGRDELTMSGNIPAKEFQNGYLLFVTFTWGSANPKIINEHIRIRISCKLTTGEVLKSSARILVMTDAEKFEKWVPGILDQVKHEGAWNAIKT